MAFNQVNKFDIAYQDKRYGNLVDPYEWNANFKTIDDNLDDNADKVNENFEMLADESGASLIGSADYIGETETVSTVAAQLEALCSRVFENYTAEQIDSILSGLVEQTVKDVSYDGSTGNFTITYADDTEESQHRTVIETELEKMPVEVEFRVTEDGVFLDLTDSRGITTSVSASSLMDVYTVADTDTIHMSMVDGEITASIKSGSITDTMLSSELIDRLQSLVDSSYTYSQSATQSASDAAESAESAESYKNSAKASADSAEEYLEAVSIGAGETANNALITEGYSVGTQHGVEVPATSPYYHNNAKYYKEKAAESAGGDFATHEELTAEATARADADNDLQEQIDAKQDVLPDTTDQAGKFMKVSSDGGYEYADIPTPEDEVFVATYGTTTYDEIKNAYDNGKIVVVKKDGMLGKLFGQLSYIGPSRYGYSLAVFDYSEPPGIYTAGLNREIIHRLMVTGSSWNDSVVNVSHRLYSTYNLGTSWTELQNGIYKNIIYIDWINEYSAPTIDLAIPTTATLSEISEFEKEWSKVFKAESSDSKITFYAKEPTTIDLSLTVGVGC